jgi:hypothetical protein
VERKSWKAKRRRRREKENKERERKSHEKKEKERKKENGKKKRKRKNWKGGDRIGKERGKWKKKNGTGNAVREMKRAL